MVLGAVVAFEFAQKLQNSIEGQRLADPAVRTAAGDDRRPVDREGNARIADQHFRLEFALFVRIVESVVDRHILKSGPDQLPGDIGGSDIMELFHLEQLGKFDHVFGAVVVDAVGAPGRIFAEVDVGGAVEDDRGPGKQRIFRELFRIDGGHIPLDHFDRFQDPVGELGASVKSALVADDFLGSLLCALYRSFAGKTDDFIILPLTKQRNDKRTADQTGDPGQKNLFHQTPEQFLYELNVRRINYTPFLWNCKQFLQKKRHRAAGALTLT